MKADIVHRLLDDAETWAREVAPSVIANWKEAAREIECLRAEQRSGLWFYAE